MHTETVRVSGGGLQGEGLLSVPATPARPPCVMALGAHPRYGGERRGVSAASVAEALLEAGFATMTLDYAAGSGAQAGPDAQSDYALAALEKLTLHNLVDGSRLGVAGYAFGASLALRVAETGAHVQAVAAIAPPARALTEAASAEILANKLLVGAGEDHDLPVQQFRFLASRLSEPAEVEVIRDADHFFTDHTLQLSEMVAGFFARRLARKAAGSR